MKNDIFDIKNFKWDDQIADCEKLFEVLKKYFNAIKNMGIYDPEFIINMENIMNYTNGGWTESIQSILLYYNAVYFTKDGKRLLKSEDEQFEITKLYNVCEKISQDKLNEMLFSESNTLYLNEVNFENVTIPVNIEFNIFNSILVKCIMYNMDLSELNFERNKFIDCVLNWADFNGSKFNDCLFINCDMQFINAVGATFGNCLFYNCNFNFAKFDDSHFPRSVILNCDMNYTSTDNTNFEMMGNLNYILLNQDIPDIEIDKNNKSDNKNKIFNSPVWSKTVGL